MGSVRCREDNGLLFLDFRYRSARCREQTALADTAANRKRLKKVLDRIESEIASGTFDYRRYFPNSRNAAKFDEPLVVPVAPMAEGIARLDAARVTTPLLRDFAETWYLEREVEWRNSYKNSIRLTLDRYLIPRFGEKEVGHISKADVLAYRAELGKVTARGKKVQLSAARINKVLNPLRQILNEAADRFDFRTPFENLKQLKVRRTDVDPFNLQEVKSIINAVRPDFRSYLTTRFFTGMRTAEVDGLKWKFVDFERRLILVRETIVLGNVEYPKNDGSQRDIQMSQIVYEALKAQQAATASRSPFVFCRKDGKPLDHKNVTNRVWYPLLRHLGLKKRRPYQCRHTAATLWLAAGEAPEWIARQLGHTTTEMLFRVYSRFVPNLTRRDGSAFERLITNAIADKALPVEADTREEKIHG